MYGGGARPWGLLLVAVALATCVAWALAWWPNTIDDAYIPFRYATNLAQGHGAVYNPGERVEGYSSPLWVALLAIAARAGADPVVTSKLLGLGFGLTALLILALALIRSGARTGLAGAAVLMIAASPTVHDYIVSGMETLAFCAAVVIAACAGAAHEGPRRLRIVAPATIAVALLRPEGLVLAVVLVAGWASRFRRRERWWLVGTVAVPVIAFLLVRHAYYGAWAPNTAIVKPLPIVHLLETHDPAAFAAMARGWRHNLWEAFDEAGGLVVLGLALPALASRDWPGVAALVAIAGFAGVALMPADWMPGCRFALPYMALAMAAAAWTVDHAVERWAARGRGAGFALAGMILVWLLRSTVTGVEEWRDRVVAAGSPPLAAQRSYKPIGDWLGSHAAPGQTLLAYEIGAVGWYSRLRVLDHEGLVTPPIAREIHRAGESGPVRTGRDSAAMERVVARCVAAAPDWFLVRTRPGPLPAPGSPFPAAQGADSLQRTLVRRFGDQMVVAAFFPLGPGAHPGGYSVLARSSSPDSSRSP